MAHNLDFSTGKASIAFRGNRSDIWHRHGQQHQDGWTVDDWAKNAGLDWTAVLVHAMADLSGMDCRGITRPMDGTPLHVRVEHDRYIVRSDNGHVLGHVSDRYQPVQPRDVLNWFEKYITADERFQLDVAGCLKQGEILWATATFKPNGSELTVAGDAHKARLLMTTSLDGTSSTINRGCMTRVVCNNTLDAAAAEKNCPIVRTRHSTKFDGKAVAAELSVIAKSFDAYKAMGEAMALHTISRDDTRKLFKHVLEIPFEAKEDEISTNKLNKYRELGRAFTMTRNERNEPEGGASAWTALNAVTRYADHERSVRGDGDAAERRFCTSVVELGGNGQVLKTRAVEYLEGIGVDWRGGDADVSAILAQPFKPTRG